MVGTNVTLEYKSVFLLQPTNISAEDLKKSQVPN